MRLKAQYTTGAEFVEVALDRGARHLFARTISYLQRMAKTRTLRRIKSMEPEFGREWFTAIDAAEKLAYIPSTVLHLTPFELGCLSEILAVSALADHYVWKPLSDVLTAAAAMNPCFFQPPAVLPEFPAHWLVQAPPAGIPHTYQQMRQARGEVVVLPLLTVYHLWIDLAGCRHLEPEVQKLCQILLGVISEFHLALEALRMRM